MGHVLSLQMLPATGMSAECVSDISCNSQLSCESQTSCLSDISRSIPQLE